MAEQAADIVLRCGFRWFRTSVPFLPVRMAVQRVWPGSRVVSGVDRVQGATWAELAV